MFGDWNTLAVPDIERTDFLLILGANPVISNGSLWTVPDYRGKARAMREAAQIKNIASRREALREIGVEA